MVFPFWATAFGRRCLSAFLLSCLYTGCDGKRNGTVVQNDLTAAHPITTAGFESHPAVSPKTRKGTGKPITVFTTVDGFESLTAIQNVDLERKKGSLLIHALSNDPSLGLPSLKVPPGSILTVQVQIVAPLQTDLQIFYNTANALDYKEANSVRKLIHKGDNYVTVEIADPAFAGNIRFDPGELPCDYTLKLLEVMAQTEDQSAVGPSPVAPIP